MSTDGALTRADLAADVRALGFSHRAARSLVDSVFTLMVDALADEERVALRRFGAFEVVRRAPKLARDLSTGAPLPLPARRVVVFRPADALRAALEASR